MGGSSHQGEVIHVCVLMLYVYKCDYSLCAEFFAASGAQEPVHKVTCGITSNNHLER